MTIADDALDQLPPLPLVEVAPQVRDGDLLLCSATDFGSRVIAWSTKSRWTHIAIAYRWEGLSRVMAFESVHTLGVRSVALSKFLERTSSGVTPYPGHILLARHEGFSEKLAADPGAVRRLGDFAVDRFGDPFASREIFKIAARILLGGLRRHVPAPLAPDDEFICSEYVARCFEAVGVAPPAFDEGFIAPGDFARDPQVRAVALFKT